MGFGAASDGHEALAGAWASATPHEHGIAFAALWTTGSDTSLDCVLRVQALRRSAPENAWESLDQLVQPLPGRGIESAAVGIVNPRGLASAEPSRALPPDEVFRSLRAFVGARAVIVADGPRFRGWAQHVGLALGPAQVFGLDEIASLLAPARAHRVASASDDAIQVRAALAETVERLAALPARAREVLASAWFQAWRGLCESDPPTAERLLAVVQLVRHPSAWRDDAGADPVVPDGPPLEPEQLALGLEELRPRSAQVGDEWRQLATVPLGDDELAPFDESQLGLLDEVFRVHLPAAFAQRAGAAASYRSGQHEVARQVAAMLGSRKLLLVHAPTGTGKTLAYLVPACLWSVRHDLRVGVSTYTRALQEQAIDQEVPLALAALARAGVDTLPRITQLKGRANYLCWRALRLHVPSDGDGGETWLAWASLLLFALTDDDGDLDRFPLRAVLACAPAAYLREAHTLVRGVRAATACCKTRADRETCAAEIARMRAERSHVVVTNHSFALARQTFFRHVIFDECEHLHDQAGSAWSHSVGVRDIREFLVHLRQAGRGSSRAVLDRLERLIFEGSQGWTEFQATITAWYATLAALETLEMALGGFRTWRDAQRRTREQRDEHSLLREFVHALEEDAAEHADTARALVDARRDLALAASELDASLSQLAATLDTLHLQGAARLRRQLELARTDLAEWLAALEAWLPLQDGRVQLRQDTFHDVEEDARGDTVLAARVLLPNEFLGRHYFPQLHSAVFISATTRLRHGFECARAYLGLERAAQPADDEVREPRKVVTFGAGDPFDYTRVLVCIPRDAPAIGVSRGAFVDYVRDFVARLGERTRGRMLVLFTNSEEAVRVGHELSGFFRARGVPLWFQGMPGVRKEELSGLFKRRASVLLGVDTFWYGADFPGDALEYLVIVKLPYGVPDRYHHAQCAVLGNSEQRRRIYLPRALAKFRQGFGRLMRRESDRGCVFVLDTRVLVGAHKLFLGELPLDSELGRSSDDEWRSGGARLVIDDTQRCLDAALAHMQVAVAPSVVREATYGTRELLDIAPDDVPF